MSSPGILARFNAVTGRRFQRNRNEYAPPPLDPEIVASRAALWKYWNKAAKIFSILSVVFGIGFLGYVYHLTHYDILLSEVSEVLLNRNYRFWGYAVGLVMLIGGTIYLLMIKCGRVSEKHDLRLCHFCFVLYLCILAATLAVAVTRNSAFDPPNTAIIKDSIDGTPNLPVWNYVQFTMKCCGAGSYEDWFNHQLWPNNSYVPESCCNTDVAAYGKSVGCGKLQPKDWWPNGCNDEYLKYFKKAHPIATFFLLLGIILLLALVCFVPAMLTCWTVAGSRPYHPDNLLD